ncbi:hypothetical protein CONLIGDRAFT_682805 [Coniochaeta ligniaria NRRL 30616]|uniref:Zn(2)-C6 fungal-type domain-containing protein n=1 Tax=Coniochaeta ligniaria NRRL 30616 TaxID=1408157 RepID=A0A1J7IK56_9PEZI|nr:hypothetical protein CONLIGDRAFT_682805 [Coniochaeta ligniaria NRRL 30616]
MPRPYNQVGDENVPICSRCEKAGRQCDRSEAPLKFKIITARGIHDDRAEPPAFRLPDAPRKVLETAQMADYFQHYISDLAPWYDLSDARSTFTTTVPRISLDDPLLFSAVMALSAMHVSNTATPGSVASSAREVAEFYHGCCIRLLINLQESDRRLEGGVALAATCLLRSYEILDTAQDAADPNRHLRGAYSLATFPFQSHESSIPTTLLSRGLFAAGFWNYLREDITFSLFRRCALKIDLGFLISPVGSVLAPSEDTLSEDEDYLNAISLILGRIINAAFVHSGGGRSNGGMKDDTWTVLLDMVKSWRAELPRHFQPFSSAKVASISALPSVRVLQNCHAASHHYCLTSLMILVQQGESSPEKAQKLRSLLHVMGSDAPDLEMEAEDLLEHLALQICGIAFAANAPAVLVNAFGPMSYASRWIRNSAAREELAKVLLACKKNTGWPGERLVTDMRSSWMPLSESFPHGEP